MPRHRDSDSGRNEMITQKSYIPNPTLYQQVVHHPYAKPLVAWMLWMLVGTCFYATVNNLGWAKGFYMAVNVGYSIGWGYPNEIDDITRLFSTAYILVGASVVAASLAYFASSVITASKEWYATALQERKLHSSDLHRRLHAWVLLNQSALQFLLVWLLIIGALVAFSLAEIKWDFSQAVYFAVASLSTGGLWAIPKESPDWYYGVVGILTAIGVPVMALTMAQIARLAISSGNMEKAQRQIAAKVTLKELEMMRKLGLVEGKGEVTRAEFILLCAVRLGALTPELVDCINYRFHSMDTSGDGALDYSELLMMPNEVIQAPKYSLTALLHNGYLQPGTAHISF